MLRTLFISAFFCALLFTLPSCEKEDPDIDNEEEVITTLVYELTPRDGGPVARCSFTDLDGDGGDAPTVTSLELAANTTYDGVITLFNEQAKPTESVHTEVLAEADEHQFFFPNDLSNVSIEYADQDSKGMPLGLKTTLMTGADETGKLTVVLKHEPTKVAGTDATASGDAVGGETDIKVVFDVLVQ